MTNLALEKLRAEIDEASMSYYTSTATITDEQYDDFIEQLRNVSPNDSRLSRVGPPSSMGQMRDKITHKMPMGSLNNVDGGIDGFKKWYGGVCSLLGLNDVEIILSLKMDGASVGLNYENGRLSCAVSRGNGDIGECLTPNAIKWQHVPRSLSIDEDLTVRGEAMLYRLDFDEIMIENGVSADAISNPRNIGNGMIQRSDGKDNDRIRFIAFDAAGLTGSTMSDRFDELNDLGFEVVQHVIVSGDDVVNEVRNMFMGAEGGRNAKQFDIDGVVAAVNDISLQQSITRNKKDQLRPRYATAIKFTSQKETTTVIGCEITLGHGGQVIPTAKLRPVRIGGVTVSNVLLNNWNERSTWPSAHHVAIGDTVVVELSGDIIPKIISVTETPEDRKIIEEPSEFNGFKTTRVIRGKAGAVTYVIGADKSDHIAMKKVKHFIGSSKKGVGILGIGDALLVSLTDELVKTPADIYRLTHADLVNLVIGTSSNGGSIRLGSSRAISLLESIEASKSVTLATFIGALGIDLLGRRRAEIVMEEHGLDTLDKWLDDAYLVRINGPAIRESIIDGIRSNSELIRDLLSVGMTIDTPNSKVETTTQDKSMAGIAFCFTGTRELIDEVKKEGGTIKSGISKNCDYLVQKDVTSKSNKSKKADEYGVTIISIDTLRSALDGTTTLP